MKIHKDLEVWNRAISFVTLIYKYTKSFPQSEDIRFYESD
ncbi:MAG: four helix bundle protein [Bacteroidales bacterium]|nr:four helix bundle protein [Bacteroidales bacterium]